MDKIWLKSVSHLTYIDPEKFLLNLSSIEFNLSASNTPQKIKNLHTNPLKEFNELRIGSLFCYGISQMSGNKVLLAKQEARDYDCIALWQDLDTAVYTPIQIKEVVPDGINSDSTLQKTINSLKKYTDSTNLTVIIYLNKEGKFDHQKLIVPALKIKSLWVLGSTSYERSEWCLWGDFLSDLVEFRFEYPS